MSILGGALKNRPKHTIKCILASSGRVKINLFASQSCAVLVRDLKHDFSGDDKDVFAQFLVEVEGT